MAERRLSAPKVILLAVQAAITTDIAVLRALVIQYQRTLRIDIVLRILLSYLPESLNSSEYVPFIEELASGKILGTSKTYVDTTSVEGVSDEDASKRVRKLHLLPLAWPTAPLDAPADLLVQFLIHRAYRVDEQTGLITQLPELITPFLDRSEYLRTWVTSSLLPLLRLNYDYYPQASVAHTIKSFEDMDEQSVVALLLSHTGKDLSSDGNHDHDKTISRDLRGLIGPWMLGDNQRKRRKLRRDSSLDAQTVAPLTHSSISEDADCIGWNETFRWLTMQAKTSWITSVEAFEQWDGPGDIDGGSYWEGSVQLEEHLQQRLERRYARTALAIAYLIPEASVEALTGAQRILMRLVALLDLDRMPTLPVAAALLKAVPEISEGLMVPENATFLRSSMLEERNILTTPNLPSITVLHALVTSAFILTRASFPCTVRKAGELALLQEEKEQMAVLRVLLQNFEHGPKGDDKYWIRARNELLWLRTWGLEEDEDGFGKGLFGKIKCDFLEMQILQALLANTRYTLAQTTYEEPTPRVLSKELLQDTVISAAMKAYDNATNANRTRGGVKKCNDILAAFPDTMKDTLASKRLGHLLNVTHAIGNYRLALKQGEPFTPVALRVHADPLSIIGKILEQNPRCYTNINELIHLGEEIVLAGLTIGDVKGCSSMEPEQEAEQISSARKRITSMCIDAALAEDDFETAYSYVMNRLASVASEAQSRPAAISTGEVAQPPPKVLDDWSWRAALQAGKYHMNSRTVRPTHLGNASGNLEIRHLEQRMECLSQALRIAPPSTLQEVLNVFRRCEEELSTKIREEAAQEAAWDEQGDETVMPGGFGAEPMPASLIRNTASAMSRTGDDAPMSLFDLTRASAAHAQRSLSALTSIKGRAASGNDTSLTMSAGESTRSSGESARAAAGVSQSSTTKRNQLKNAAVGTLASGIGWLINAPMPPQHSSPHGSDPESS